MTTRRRFYPDGGMVLMYALSVLVIVAIMGLSLQQTGSSLQQISKESQYRRLAQQAAESGVRYGVGYIRFLVDPVDQYVANCPPNLPAAYPPSGYTGGPNPNIGNVACARMHTSTPVGMGGNIPPVHPCNIYWRLHRGDASSLEIQPWVTGWNVATGQPIEMAVPDLHTAVNEPNRAPAVDNPALYRTSFRLKVQAINVRGAAMNDEEFRALPAANKVLGAVTVVGLRARDLVDAAMNRYCHWCTNAQRPPGPPTPPPALPPPPENPMCYTRPTTTEFAANALEWTTGCSFVGSQPYLLTATGTCRIVDPVTPFSGGQPNLLASSVATVAVSQVITVSCRNRASPQASVHSTYIVTVVNQER